MQKIELIKETVLPYSCCVISVIFQESLFNFETSHIFCTGLLYYFSIKTFQAKIWPGCCLHSKPANRHFPLRWILSPSARGVGIHLIIVMVLLEICYTARKGVWIFWAIVLFCTDRACFFAHPSAVTLFQLLQFPCQRPWKSLALLSVTVLDRWRFEVRGSRVGSRRKTPSLKVRCVSWAMRPKCEGVSIGYWFFWVFCEQGWSIGFLFPCLFFCWTYQNPSILLWSSAFKEGSIHLSGGNKTSKVSLRILK